ncbi:MAG: hypothetical protein RIG61_08195 [Deltaproteobacteria bacterium]
MLAVLSTGCYPAGYYRPQEPKFNPTPTIHTSEDGVRVTVIPSYWTGSPRNLESYVTPFYIEIENFSDKTLSFTYEDIVLFDEFRTQSAPLGPEAVAGILASSEKAYAYPSYPRVSIGIGGGYYGGYYRGGPWGYYGPYYRPYGFYSYSPVWYSPPAPYYYSRPVSTKDVVTEALRPGIVYPRAAVKGYVYFKRIPDEVNHVTLDVAYGIERTEEYRTLSFPFSVGWESY